MKVCLCGMNRHTPAGLLWLDLWLWCVLVWIYYFQNNIHSPDVFSISLCRFGRQISFLVSNILNAVAGIAVAIAPNYISILVFRTILGFSVKGGWMTSYVLRNHLHVFWNWFFLWGIFITNCVEVTRPNFWSYIFKLFLGEKCKNLLKFVEFMYLCYFCMSYCFVSNKIVLLLIPFLSLC